MFTDSPHKALANMAANQYVKRHTPSILKGTWGPKGKKWKGYKDAIGSTDLPVHKLWSYIVKTANAEQKLVFFY